MRLWKSAGIGLALIFTVLLIGATPLHHRTGIDAIKLVSDTLEVDNLTVTTSASITGLTTLNLDSLDVDMHINCDGTAQVDGRADFDGTVDLGNSATADTVFITSRVGTAINPIVTDSLGLGTASLRWDVWGADINISDSCVFGGSMDVTGATALNSSVLFGSTIAGGADALPDSMVDYGSDFDERAGGIAHDTVLASLDTLGAYLDTTNTLGQWADSTTYITPIAQRGIVGWGCTTYGAYDSTHVCLGVNNTTGESGEDYRYCTIGGGESNTASEEYATVSGGSSNTVSGGWATVSGGYSNTASGYNATVGGGNGNTASGEVAVVVGGGSNTVDGNLSFAYGYFVDVPTDTTAQFYCVDYPGHFVVGGDVAINKDTLSITSTVLRDSSGVTIADVDTTVNDATEFEAGIVKYIRAGDSGSDPVLATDYSDGDSLWEYWWDGASVRDSFVIYVSSEMFYLAASAGTTTVIDTILTVLDGSAIFRDIYGAYSVFDSVQTGANGTPIHGEWRGSVTWPNNTERYPVYAQGITSGGLAISGLMGSTPADFTISMECVTDSVVFNMEASDTAAAAGNTFTYTAWD